MARRLAALLVACALLAASADARALKTIIAGAVAVPGGAVAVDVPYAGVAVEWPAVGGSITKTVTVGAPGADVAVVERVGVAGRKLSSTVVDVPYASVVVPDREPGQQQEVYVNAPGADVAVQGADVDVSAGRRLQDVTISAVKGAGGAVAVDVPYADVAVQWPAVGSITKTVTVGAPGADVAVVERVGVAGQ